jgi:hypothetical protein
MKRWSEEVLGPEKTTSYQNQIKVLAPNTEKEK